MKIKIMQIRDKNAKTILITPIGEWGVIKDIYANILKHIETI